MGIPALAFPRYSASLESLCVGKRGKPVLLEAAIRADTSPPADYSPVAEKCGLDIDLIKAGEVAGVVGSFHIDSCHGSKSRRVVESGSKIFWQFPTVCVLSVSYVSRCL